MPRKLAILAGGGRLPELLIDACRRSGRPHVVIAFKGHASPAIKADAVIWRRLGAGGRIIKDLATQEVEQVILAGSIRRPRLAQLLPDFWSLCLLLKTGALKQGDDGLLRVLIGALAARDIAVVGVADIAPDLLTHEGDLCRTTPTRDDLTDIAAAVKAARDLGKNDIGQAAVAREGRIIAEEGRGGTDVMLAAIQRPAGERASGALVKCLKPGQDMRVDLPAIGPETVANVNRAGLRGIAVEAGQSLIIDREKTIRAADEAGIFIRGLKPEEFDNG